VNRSKALQTVQDIMTQRGSNYGDLRKNWCEGAKRMSRVFKKEVTPEQYGVAMIGVKMARLQSNDCRHLDSLLDIIGYAALTIEILGENDEH
jgi:hypothetical protein